MLTILSASEDKILLISLKVFPGTTTLTDSSALSIFIFLIAILWPSRPTTLNIPSLTSKSSPVIILLLSLGAVEKSVWLIVSLRVNCDIVMLFSLIIAGR